MLMSPVNTISRSGEVDDQAVVRLAAADRDEHELDSAHGQLLGLADQPVRRDPGAMAPAARQEVPEGRRPGILAAQLVGKARLGDHGGAVRRRGREPSDMVEVRVGQDDVRHRQVGDLAQVTQRRGGVLGRAGGVDGDDPGGG